LWGVDYENTPAALNVLPVELIAQIAYSTESIEGTVDRAHRDNWSNIECPIEIEMLDELCFACNWLTMAVFAKPTSERPEENAIAARLVELSDRLGGFIKPSLQSPNQNT
jgi:hypothetical protein